MPFHSRSTIVVVGASLAGLRAAETLRAEGFDGRVVVVGAEPHLPYDRPPLSKQYLAGTWDLDRIRLRDGAKLDALGLDLRLGRRATGLDPQGRRVDLDDGTRLAYDGLVVATGAHPRRLPGTEANPAVHVLRTLDDAEALRKAVHEPGVRVVVVGAGFIGAEVAATCHTLGAAVTVVEALATPLSRAIGEELGAVAGALHTDHGVTLRTGVGVTAIDPPGATSPARVHLDDGAVLDADAVVVGIGVVPTTGWVEGSGLECRDGVVADDRLFAGDDVVVAGDLARYHDDRLGAEVRVEHWTNAAEQAMIAARNLLAGRAAALPYRPVPYFWSDQYDVKIQVIGHPHPEDEVVVVDGTGSLEERRFVALYRHGDRLGAVLAFGRPRQLMGYRPLLEAGASFDEALAHQP